MSKQEPLVLFILLHDDGRQQLYTAPVSQLTTDALRDLRHASSRCDYYGDRDSLRDWTERSHSEVLALSEADRIVRAEFGFATD